MNDKQKLAKAAKELREASAKVRRLRKEAEELGIELPTEMPSDWKRSNIVFMPPRVNCTKTKLKEGIGR